MKGIRIFVTLFIYFGLNAVVQSAQFCNSQAPLSSPNDRFQFHNFGAVTDTVTGLMWQRCAVGQGWTGSDCTGDVSVYSWEEALVVPADTTLGGHADWRVPNVKELASIVELGCTQPAINLNIFPLSLSTEGYWSSSPVTLSGYYPDKAAYFVNFSYGDIGSQRQEAQYLHPALAVRLVRDGKL